MLRERDVRETRECLVNIFPINWAANRTIGKPLVNALDMEAVARGARQLTHMLAALERLLADSADLAPVVDIHVVAEQVSAPAVSG